MVIAVRPLELVDIEVADQMIFCPECNLPMSDLGPFWSSFQLKIKNCPHEFMSAYSKDEDSGLTFRMRSCKKCGKHIGEVDLITRIKAFEGYLCPKCGKVYLSTIWKYGVE